MKCSFFFKLQMAGSRSLFGAQQDSGPIRVILSLVEKKLNIFLTPDIGRWTLFSGALSARNRFYMKNTMILVLKNILRGQFVKKLEHFEKLTPQNGSDVEFL